MATLTTTPILTRVAALIQDPTNVRWPKPELLAYLSDGQRELCLFKPDACAKTAVVNLVADTRQVLPSDGVVLIDVVRNMAGSKRAPRVVTREILDVQTPDWHTSAPDVDIKYYTFDPQNQRVFYVYPPNTGTGSLEVVYAVSPPELADGDALQVDSVWLPALVNYVMYRCYSKDAEYAANANLAVAYYQAFTNLLAGKTSAEAALDARQNSVGTAAKG